MTRAFFTLIGAGAAGGLIWVGAQLSHDTTGQYWARIGIVAGAGLALALARLPDVGVRTLPPSFPTFGLGFLTSPVAHGRAVAQAPPQGTT